MTNLFEFWNKPPLGGPPFVFQADQDCLHGYDLLSCRLDFGDFVAKGKDVSFNFDLLPVPYIGDVCRAKVVILNRNPGLNFGDSAEPQCEEFREAIRQTIQQRFRVDEEFRFVYLNPRFCWHPGFRWWEEKVRTAALKLAEEHSWKYELALKNISHVLACIELIPYHSRNFPEEFNNIASLPSAMAAKKLVNGMKERQDVKFLIHRKHLNGWNEFDFPDGKMRTKAICEAVNRSVNVP